MRQSTNYILIGTFVIAASLIGVAGVVMLGAGALSRNELVFETYFEESVQGLDVGAHVRFRGVKIGQVTEITLTSDEYQSDQPLVLVRFAVRPLSDRNLAELSDLVTTRLGEGLRARLTSQGLTGALYLEADLYPDADEKHPPLPHAWTPRYRYIPSLPSKIVELTTAVQTTLSNLQDTDFAGLVRDLRGTLSSLQSAIDDLDTAKLSAQVGDVATTAKETLDQVNDSLDSFTTHIDRIASAIEADDVRGTMQDIRKFAAGLEPTRETLVAALDDARKTVGDVRSTVQGRGRDIDQILDNVRRISVSFANLADTLEQYPSLLMFGDPPARSKR